MRGTGLKSLIIAIDFDGTIVEHKFPKIGKPMPGAIETIKEFKEAGHKLILWTCREDEGHNINRQYLREAVEFCEKQGIKFDAVNETIEEEEFRTTGLKRKPYAHYYIDDAIVGGFPGWDKIKDEILG